MIESEETRDERQASELPPTFEAACAELFRASEVFREAKNGIGADELGALMTAVGRWTAHYREQHPELGGRAADDTSEKLPW